MEILVAGVVLFYELEVLLEVAKSRLEFVVVLVVSLEFACKAREETLDSVLFKLFFNCEGLSIAEEGEDGNDMREFHSGW